MLLTRLVDYAHADLDAPPPFYAPKRVRWVVELNADGTLASDHLTDLADPSDRDARNGRVRTVPVVQRSGTAPQPMLAADTAEYALGWTADQSRTALAARYHAAFGALVADWAAADPTQASTGVHIFLRNNGPARVVRDSSLTGNQLVAFRVAGEFAHETDAANRFWAAEAARRKGSARTDLCLVCGQVGRLLKTIPQQLPTRLVPGATNNASLVSMNKATHGFDLREQLVHTPICATCGLQAMTALETLLDGASSTTLPGQDARLAWWVTQGTPFDLATLDEPAPQRVATLLSSAAKGESPGTPDVSMFCALVIGGNIARVVIREWIELPLDDIVANLNKWFDDHQVTDVWSGEPVHIAIHRLALAAGRWIPGRNHNRGMYSKFGAPGADRPEGLYRALLRTALLGKPLPPKLAAHIIHRIRSDGRVDTERAALVRLSLRRRLGIPNPESYMPELNPESHQPAYLAGRIFAVLEDLQRYAAFIRGGEPLNVTFADRYFARAITSPAVALVAGRRDARAWLKRLRRDRPGLVARYEQQLADLFARLDDAVRQDKARGVPHGAALGDQLTFILGYSQQRATARAERAAASAANTDVSEADLEPEGAPA